jgi:hypothetical protein
MIESGARSAIRLPFLRQRNASETEFETEEEMTDQKRQ